MPGMKWIEPIVFSKSSGNPIFGQIFGHQRAKNEPRNTEMYRGQETHPIRVNARYEMNWANSFSKKFPKPCLQTAVYSKINCIIGRTDERADIGMNPVYPHSTFGGAGVWLSELSFKQYMELCVFSRHIFLVMIVRICVFYLIITINKLPIWIISHCLGLGFMKHWSVLYVLQYF